MLNDFLYPYQQEAVEKSMQMLKKYGAMYNASDPGTGKTVISAGVINILQSTSKVAKTCPMLIVCPTTMVYTWKAELKTFCNINAVVVDSTKGIPEEFNIGVVYIVTYKLLSYTHRVTKESNLAKFLKTTWALIIADECQAIKSLTALQTTAVRSVAKCSYYKIFLSGTPFINCSNDAFPVFNTCEPLEYPCYYKFSHRYSNVVTKTRRTKRGGLIYTTDFVGVKNTKELSDKLRASFFLRYKRSDMESKLPKLVLSKVYLPPSCEVELEKELEQQVLAEIEKSGNRHYTAGMAEWRINAALRKLPHITEFAEDLLAQNKTIIIFAHHKEVVAKYAEALSDYNPGVITGEVSSKNRAKIIEEVQSGERKILIANITAGGVGITVTAASEVIYAEHPWTYADFEQSLSRAYRNGQKNAVTVYSFLVKDTIDESIYRIINNKKVMHDNLMNKQ